MHLLNSSARFGFVFVSQLMYFSNLVIDLLFFDGSEDDGDSCVIDDGVMNMTDCDNDVWDCWWYEKDSREYEE